METNLSKFGLFDSMMNRLGVNPSVLTLEWLQHCTLSFVCVPAENSQNSSKLGIAGKVVSFRHPLEKVKEEALSPATSESEDTAPAPETPVSEEPVSPKALFYESDWEQLDDKFELNNRTLSQLRCGMYAYLHGSKIVVTQKTLSSQKVRNQNYIFAGIVFDLQENSLRTVKLCAFKSSHAKALKKMLPEHRFPSVEECETIYIYQEVLNQAFQKMNINFGKTEKVFYDGPELATKGKLGLFNFANGETSLHAIDTAVADAYQIQTITLN